MVRKIPIKALGFVIGLSGLLGFAIGQVFDLTINHNSKARIFREEDRPAAIRIYQPGSRDNIFMQNMIERPGEYITFQKYLESIPNKYDRKIEEAKIKKQVEW